MDPKYYSVPEQDPNGIPPQGYGYPPVPPMQPSEPPRPLRAAYRPATRRDLIFAGVLAVLCILAANFYLWGGAGIAASIVSVLIFCTGTCYLWRDRRRFSVYALYCGAAYVIGAGAFLISNGGFLHVLLVHLLGILSAVAIMEVMELRNGKDNSMSTVGDFFRTAFGLTFGSIGAAFYGIFHKEEKGEVGGRKMGAPLLGLACAIPVLLIVIPLLMSSDEAFSNLLNKLALDNAAELIFSVLFGVFAFLMIFSRLFALPMTEKWDREAKDRTGMPTATLCVSLGLISLVYVLYLVSQLSYFFDAFSGLLPNGFQVAEYARRGFFEMCAVCAINLLIIFLAALLSRKKEGHAPLAIRLFSLFLCLFSLVLISTAVAKMFLYIDSFGMTRLRILTTVFMIFLAVMFLTVGLRIFLPRIPYLKVAVIVGSFLLIATCYANVDGMIARYNVTAYQNHKLDSIDMDTLAELDDDSTVPWLLELLEDKDALVRIEVKDQLRSIFDNHFMTNQKWVSAHYEKEYTYESLDWRAYNLTSAKAHELLWENRETFLNGHYEEIQ